MQCKLPVQSNIRRGFYAASRSNALAGIVILQPLRRLAHQTASADVELSALLAVKQCPGLPAALPFTSAWPESCSNATHGAVCNATCDQQGIGRAEVRCDAGVWQAPRLACARE
jgi:hypothetical protein